MSGRELERANLTLQFKKVQCHIEASDETLGLRGKTVRVCE